MDAETKEEFEKLCTAIRGLPGVEIKSADARISHFSHRGKAIVTIMALLWVYTACLLIYTSVTLVRLRKVYNEVAMQIIVERLPKETSQTELRTIRDMVIKSHPSWQADQGVYDLGVYKNDTGWHAR